MNPVTYDLRSGGSGSGDYYRHIHQYSTVVYNRIEEKAGYVISGLIDFAALRAIEKPRSRAEYAVEVLTLGMTWNRYLGASQHTALPVIGLLSRLYSVRRTNRRLKPGVDRLRGLITGRCVVPAIGLPPKDASFSLMNFGRLLRWLEATGEFKDEVKRLTIWYQFLETLGKGGPELALALVLDLFHWFADESQRELGVYTSGVDEFLRLKHPAYVNREDVIFCGKQEVEYHLNMVGAEIMNRGFAPAYSQTKRKVVLVPGCMRPADAAGCKAVVDDVSITCTRCNPDCHVGRLDRLGQQHGFKVFIVPHSASFTKWLKQWENDAETGLVAVACLLNLVPGGYEMRELNIAAQCLLLDYCGCRKHWHPTGIETAINQERLLELVK